MRLLRHIVLLLLLLRRWLQLLWWLRRVGLLLLLLGQLHGHRGGAARLHVACCVCKVLLWRLLLLLVRRHVRWLWLVQAPAQVAGQADRLLLLLVLGQRLKGLLLLHVRRYVLLRWWCLLLQMWWCLLVLKLLHWPATHGKCQIAAVALAGKAVQRTRHVAPVRHLLARRWRRCHPLPRCRVRRAVHQVRRVQPCLLWQG